MAWVDELTNLVGEAASALMTDCPTSPVAPMIVTFMMDSGVDFQRRVESWKCDDDGLKS